MRSVCLCVNVHVRPVIIRLVSRDIINYVGEPKVVFGAVGQCVCLSMCWNRCVRIIMVLNAMTLRGLVW